MKFFTREDMICCWKRFEAARNKEGLTVGEAWSDLIAMGKKKSEPKRYSYDNGWGGGGIRSYRN